MAEGHGNPRLDKKTKTKRLLLVTLTVCVIAAAAALGLFGMEGVCADGATENGAFNVIADSVEEFDVADFQLPVAVAGIPINVGNPGFEENMKGDSIPKWDVYNYREKFEGRPDISTITIDHEYAYSGVSSLRISNTSLNDVRVTQKLKVEPESVYRISCYAMTEGVGYDGCGANISILGLLVVSRDITGDMGDWELIELYGMTDYGQKELEIAVGLGGYGRENYGTVWIDDVSVEKVDYAQNHHYAAMFYDPGSAGGGGGGDNERAQPNEMPSLLKGILVLTIIAALGLTAVIAYRGHGKRDETAGDAAEPTETAAADSNSAGDTAGPAKFIDRRDIIIMAAMTLIYFIIAIIRLGNHAAPQTFWKSTSTEDVIVFNFGGRAVSLDRLVYNCNTTLHSEWESRYSFEYMDETGEYRFLTEIRDKSFYEYKYVDLYGVTAHKVRMSTVEPGMSLNEIAFFETGQESVPVSIFIEEDETVASIFGSVANLTDEQGIVPYRPDVMNSAYFDEIYFPRTAYEYIKNMPLYETTHPPLGKVFIAAGILIFGMNPFGWRIFGTIAGVAMIPAMYLFGKKLFKKRLYAFCSAFLMMFDFMHFAQTRLSTIDSYTVLFIIMMYYYMYDSFMDRVYDRDLRTASVPLFLSGLFFGVGAATKWIVLYGAAGLAFVFFLARFLEAREFFIAAAMAEASATSRARSRKRNKSRSRAKSRNRGRQQTGSKTGVKTATRVGAGGELISRQEYKTKLLYLAALCVLFFLLIPGAIYTLSYIPYTNVPGASDNLVGAMLENQKSMFEYHSALTDTHPFESVWWSWPVIRRPIWYYNGSGLPNGIKAVILSFGNPLVWWVGIPCFFAAFFIAYKKKDKNMALVLAAFIFQYAPWVLVARSTYIYHYFSSLPFVIFFIVYTIKNLIEAKVINDKVVFAYLGAVMMLFAVYYPVLSGLPVTARYSDALRLFSTWGW